MVDYLLHGILVCLEPINLLAMLLSVPLGIIVGALPGFGAATGLVLVLPLTYTLEPGTAFVIMTGIYLGCEYGGCISAILINTPGTAAAIVTGEGMDEIEFENEKYIYLPYSKVTKDNVGRYLGEE